MHTTATGLLVRSCYGRNLRLAQQVTAPGASCNPGLQTGVFAKMRQQPKRSLPGSTVYRTFMDSRRSCDIESPIDGITSRLMIAAMIK